MTAITSPLVPALWPHLIEPSVYTPKGGTPDPDDKGSYSAMLLLDPNKGNHSEFIAAVNDSLEELFTVECNTKGKKLKKSEDFSPFKDQEDEDGNETGMVVCRPKKKAGGITKSGRRKGQPWSSALPLYDQAGEKFKPEEGKSLSNGTILRVEVETFIYPMGGKYRGGMRMTGAQIAMPRWYDGGGGTAFKGAAIEDEDFEEAIAPQIEEGQNF